MTLFSTDVESFHYVSSIILLGGPGVTQYSSTYSISGPDQDQCTLSWAVPRSWYIIIIQYNTVKSWLLFL